MEDDRIVEKIAKISIRGRMAIALACLDIVFPDTSSLSSDESSLLSEIMAELGRFLYENDLGEWSNKIESYDPFYLIGDNEDWSSEELRLKSLYNSLPIFFIDMIENAIDIGRSEIGVSIQGYSKRTIDSLMKIFELMRQNCYPIPELENYSKYKFEINRGWGEKVYKN